MMIDTKIALIAFVMGLLVLTVCGFPANACSDCGMSNHEHYGGK